MARQVVSLVASLAVLQAAASPSFLIEELQIKERALSVTDGLSPASDNGRGLQGQGNDLCYFNLLNVFENKVMNNWQKCINEKAKVKNMSIAGQIVEMNVECWCEEDIEATLSLYGCCQETGAYQDYCKAICPPLLDTCTTAEAQKCIEDCPALCFEKDYAPSFCDSGCTGCDTYVLCITGHSKNKTLSGHVEHQPICSDNAFYSSQEWKDWFDCYSSFPKRTHWARHNAENYCYCNSSLKAAASRYSCCNADWGKTICDGDCSNAQTIDCASAEAQTCVDGCKQTCSKIFKVEMTQACKEQCMDASATCEKYRICEPSGPFAFDYVCDDGSLPNVQGCCTGKWGNPVCPSLCSSATGHHPTLEAVNVLVTNANMECSCQGCPSSIQQTKDKYKETLDDHLFETGTLEIARIARKVGMTGPNAKMQELLLERDAEIKELYDALPGLPDDDWQAQMNAVMAEYTPKFLAEANRYAQDGPRTTIAPGTANYAKGEDPEGESDSPIILIIVIALCGVFALVFGVILILKCQRVKRTPGGQRPRDGDPNVVMGRPVAPGTDAVAAEGSPVDIGEKGEDNTKV